MAIFLLSLMGIPPLVGFMGKLYVFAAIIERGPGVYWYAVVGGGERGRRPPTTTRAS